MLLNLHNWDEDDDGDDDDDNGGSHFIDEHTEAKGGQRSQCCLESWSVSCFLFNTPMHFAHAGSAHEANEHKQPLSVGISVVLMIPVLLPSHTQTCWT